MGQSSIPVDVCNPGQVFACMGFLEAAEVLCGAAKGGFRWESVFAATARFELTAPNCEDPVARVLGFVAGADVLAAVPDGWRPIKLPAYGGALIETGDTYPVGTPGESSLAIALKGSQGEVIHLGHWTDDSSRDEFKLYSGNRTAWGIAFTQVKGKSTARGKVTVRGIAHLWEEQREELVDDPFGLTVPMGGSFNMDARAAWLSIDAGYSPNDHDQQVVGSPVVELMGALGLEHARPYRREVRYYQYALWWDDLPPVLARPTFAGLMETFGSRWFTFSLGLSGKNKIVQYAQEEKRR